MSETWVCGTGGWSGPQPGDPDNNVTLRAVAVLGGIEVTWSYPAINPHAVSYVKLYRSTSGTDADPPEVGIVSGNTYFDRHDDLEKTTYYYWIEIASIHGTVNDRIGPAAATYVPLAEDLIRYLTGKIDNGVLAQSLKTEIARIQLNKLGITQEMIDRAAEDDALGVAFNEVVAHSDETRALLQEEVVARTTANEAFVQSVNTVYAAVGENTAAIQQEQSARVTQDSALAEQITTTQSQLGTDIASVETKMETNIERVDGKITEIGALYTAKVDVNGLVGGFGVYNNGRTVEAGFDVDRLWIGRTNSAKVKPFIYSGGQFYFNGQVSFSNIQGAGDLASKNALDYTDIKGTKPPSDADRTSENTARDTQYVAGHDASALAGAAIYGRDRAVEWVRPNTTLINGNKIYTGDAYVDTLQIKGQAITIPVTVGGGDVYIGRGGAATVLSTPNYNCEGGGFTALFTCNMSTVNADVDAFGRFEIYVNGGYQTYQEVGIRADGGNVTAHIPVCIAYNGGGGWGNVYISIRAISITNPGGSKNAFHVRTPQVTFLGTKR